MRRATAQQSRVTSRLNATRPPHISAQPLPTPLHISGTNFVKSETPLTPWRWEEHVPAQRMLRPICRSSMLSIRAALGVRFLDNPGYPRSKPVLGLHRSAIIASKGAETRDPDTVGAKFICKAAGPPSAVEPMSVEENNEIQLLPAVNDDHGGVIIEMKDKMEPRDFVTSLRLSLFHWRQQGRRGVWIKLPIELSSLVHPAVEEGFWYHHAEPSYLMLVYWIPLTDNTLPVNASHRVGVGAFVLNDKKEVLAVQEKNGKLRGTGIWKIPTGVVDNGEDICSGAVREVKEETGIDTEFIEKQESEIEAAQWMPLEEFATQPYIQKHELVKYIVKVGSAKAEGAYGGFSPISIASAFTDQKSYIYLNSNDTPATSKHRI